jgi:hypothetical protein
MRMLNLNSAGDKYIANLILRLNTGGGGWGGGCIKYSKTVNTFLNM